ncbi:MAG: lytic murein transglycosylase [Patescibacteria group bacterium]
MILFTKKAFVLAIACFLLLVFATNSAFALSSIEERKILEEELAKLEKQIAETEVIVEQYKKQGNTLEGEINKFDSEIRQKNLQIKAINLSVEKLNAEIGEKKAGVVETEAKLDEHKGALKAALRNMYEQETESIVEILLQSPSLSNFFANVNGLLEVQEGLNIALQETLAARDKLLNEKEDLALQKSDEESLKNYRDSQKQELESKKVDKKELLDVTKGEESKYQELLVISKQTAAQIRSRIFEFLGGGQLTFEQAYVLAKSAGDLTGIRPAMILAVLDKESALGSNVGQCGYQEAMHPTRDLPAFLEIVAELGISPDSVKVSCPISYDGAYGGAMGPAQFIPSTWQIYKDRIASLTGSNPPSPWRNLDAFVGTALYLKDARSSSACVNYADEYKHILLADILQDRCAAAKYYAGSRWWNYRLTYGERVIDRAAQFEADIKQISS